MSPVAQAILASWTIRPGLVIALLVVGIVYTRGFRQLQVQMPERFPRWRRRAFVAGLATLLAALASPLDAFSGLLLQVHMIQHLLLMLVAPPLLLLGAPAIPLLRGLPASVAKDALGPFLTWPALRRCGEALTHPLVGWLALFVVTWGWHAPAAYQLALRAPFWHAVEHGCFITAALLFWWPVVQPWPSLARWPRWTIVPYLLLADVQNTIFSAFFTFSERLIYPFYAAVPRLGGITALDDQIVAGAIMWVPASLFFLIPAAAVMVQVLSPQSVRRLPTAGVPRPSAEAARSHRQFDMLTVPLLGRLLRAPYARRVAQAIMLGLAFAVIVDGLFGPLMSPMNLAGVLPWTYWRGFTVLALLVAGNVFCFACPFMLPRALARRLGFARVRWPRPLRSKWLAVILLVAFFCAYEGFDLWDSPRWTAWLIVAYFAGALLIDGRFEGASFCKYVCPIGQFHFVQSLISPLEVRVRQPQACASCTTHDCLRGNDSQRGCELELFLPRKVGNLDCTFCLDCVHACPHDNIGIVAVVPGSDLVDDRRRSSLGRLSRRPDVGALVLLLVFAAFAGAAAMVEPVTVWQLQISRRLGMDSAKPVMIALLLGALVIVPPVLSRLAANVGRIVGRVEAPATEIGRRFAFALIPLGVAMWAAHFLFHLLTGWGAAVPAVQRVLADLGFAAAGTASWTPAPTGVDGLWLQLLLLDAGLLLSLYVGWRLARGYAPRARAALGLMTPWAVVAVGLYLGGVWTFLQPMQMRGTMMHAMPVVASVR